MYLPSGQSVHVSESLLSENLPSTQAPHSRFNVPFGELSTCCPATHVWWLEQNVEPAAAWYCPPVHAVQFGAFDALEKRPTAHTTHRSGPASELSASYVPGLHGCFESQYGWPTADCSLPPGHAVHAALFATLENVSVGQPTQRSELELELSLSNVPGMHGCFVSQNGWLTLSWNLPFGHAVHAGALAAPENLPAGHATQRSELELLLSCSYVPGLHGCLESQ
jgi:hypothetical protein